MRKIRNIILHLFIQKTVISGVPNIAGKYFQPLPTVFLIPIKNTNVTYFFKVSSCP